MPCRKGELVVRSNFDVYLRGDDLVYIKEPCSPNDIAARFFLHVTLVDIEGLSEDRREHGFDNLDFEFSSFGIVDGGRCIAVRDLPEYTIELILTGQFAEDGRIWRTRSHSWTTREIDFPKPRQ